MVFRSVLLSRELFVKVSAFSFFFFGWFVCYSLVSYLGPQLVIEPELLFSVSSLVVF